MTNETIAAFIAALPEKYRERAAAHLANVTAERVFNADYVEAKFILGRAVDQAWDALKVPYDLRCDLGSVMCLHDIISMSKKVNKAGFNLDTIEPLRTFCAAVLPVALLMKDLKNKTIKARKPNPAAEAKKAAKALTEMPKATCGCCFGKQAVLPNGRIHDHGYTLPHEWMKTASCPGRRFRPLEVSVEGPMYMVTVLAEAEDHCAFRLKQAPSKTEVSKVRYNGETKVIKRGDPQFEYELRSHIAGLESNLRAIQADLTKFRKVVAEWKAA